MHEFDPLNVGVEIRVLGQRDDIVDTGWSRVQPEIVEESRAEDVVLCKGFASTP